MMSKVQLTRAQVEMAQKLGLVKFEGGKMFLMNNAPRQVQWSAPNPVQYWGPPLATIAAPKLKDIAEAVGAEERFTLEDMRGQVFTKVYANVDSNGDRTELVFENDEFIFTFMHEDDCCESVYIEDIVGDLNDLVGKPLDIVEEVEYDRDFNPPDVEPVSGESFTWTFYKFATIKGWVDVRWLGESNGYYSESVDFRGVRK
jgi:hypothetical protein